MMINDKFLLSAFFCLTVLFTGSAYVAEPVLASSNEPDYASGMALLGRNVSYIEQNTELLGRMDARLAAMTPGTPEHDEALREHFEIVERLSFLENRTRNIMRDYNLVDNPLVRVGDATRDFRLRISGRDLAILQRMASRENRSVSNIILDALKQVHADVFPDPKATP